MVVGDRDRGNEAFRLCVRILFMATLVMGQWPSIQLDGALRVQKGLTTGINLTITGLDNLHLSHCKIRQVPHTAHLSCGNLRPSSMRCDSSSMLVYQHHGCSSTRELLYLQLFARKNDTATVAGVAEHHVRFFALEITVEDFYGRQMYLEATTLPPSVGYEYTQLTPIFPPEWIGKCYYRIVRSILPTAVVQGMVNSPLPCGYVPREPFLLLEDAQQNRSVLVEVTGTSNNMPAMQRVLLFANSTRQTQPLVLPHTILRILQFSYTPVMLDVLSCPNSYRQCVYVFPVLPAGAFIPAYSPDKPPNTHTRFTSEDIAAGIVSFVPNEDTLIDGGIVIPPLPLINTYNYNVFDYSGHMLARGAVEVTVMRRDWNYPSLRFIASPQVRLGGHVALNARHLQFYIPPNSYCMENTFVRLIQRPIHGRWIFAESGRYLEIDEPVYHTLFQNETLVYQHNGDESAITDGTIWNVTCDDGSFQLHMSLIIIPMRSDEYSEIEVQPSTLIAFCERASPLLLNVPVYPDYSLRFDVNASEGVLVRTTNTEMLTVYPQPPYIPSKNLVSNATVTQFSIEEVQQNLIWYIPTCSAMNALEVSVHEPRQSTVNTLRFQVLYSTVSIENFFLLSSSENHLKIVKNQPLPVASTDAAPVYITTSFLYTQCDICQSSAVVYRVVVPPQYGHICLASGDVHNCTQSLHQFTQSDLDRFMIVYKPDNESNAQFGKYNDSFIFELRYHGFGLKPPLTGLFSIFAAQYEPLILSEEQLWVGIGGTETIPHRYFRSVIVQPQTFHIITLPQFGELFMMSSSQQQSSTVEESDIYTLEQLKNNQFQYRHYNNVTRRHCSDSFTFVAINSTHSVTETIVIAIRQRRNHLLGLWRETKSVLSQDNFVFTSQDFNVLSDFCLVFVQFTLQSQPVLGNLRLYHPPLHTFEQLGNGSVFTAEDVRDGRLWYTANDYLSSVTSGQVMAIETMKFYLSDPKNFRDPSEHVNSKKRIDFEVTFLRPPEETLPISTVFITRDIYVLSWLPQRQGFGYIFQPMDIRVESTPSLHERNISVKILVKESPRRGWIQRDGQPVSECVLYVLCPIS